MIPALTIALAFLAPGDDPPTRDALSGRWKLVADGAGLSEFAIFDFDTERGEPVVKVVDRWFLFSRPRAYVARSADALVVLVTQEDGYGDIVFKGNPAKLDADGRIPGAFQFSTDEAPVPMVLPARLERTREATLAKPKANPPEPQPGVIGEIGGLLARGKPLAELRDKRYAALDLMIARRAEADLRIDSPMQSRAWSAARLAEAAARADQPTLAAEAQARLKTLRALVAEENRDVTGPLVVEPFQGKREPGEDRVVLLELFTGTQSGASIPANAAFDALASADGPNELIAIQHHVNLPGIDPLSNPDSVARQAHNKVGRVPASFFNGRNLAGGGLTGRGDARRIFHIYRNVVDTLIKGPKQATITLKVQRDGDTLQITAIADANVPANLRLALVEDLVDYKGVNGVTRHRNVVRSMPGGAGGIALVGGNARFEGTITLDALRRDLHAYMLDRVGDSPLPGGPPLIALKRLSVVAFVQGEDGEILHAVRVAAPNTGD